jgi:glycosyltransferase involved in cell wall biosynthesis
VFVTAARFDLVLIQRKLFSTIFIRLLRKAALKIVFDFDDAINLRSNGKISKTRRNKFETVIKAAGLVLASNSYLAESASILGAKVEISPTSVNVDRYLSQIPKLEKIILVWIGSRSTSRYLESHRDILEALGEKIPGIRLRVILYMAAGLPVVSSVVGSNREVTEHGEAGFLAAVKDEWLKSVGEMVNSRQLREQMVESARLQVKERYSSDATIRRLLSSLDQLLGA